MHVLHITTQVPHPHAADGGSTRQYWLLKGLAERGYEVTVVSPVTTAQNESLEPGRVLDAAGVRLLSVPRSGCRESELLRGVTRNPRLLPELVRAPLYGLQSELLAERLAPMVALATANTRFDVLTVEHDHAAALGGLVQPSVPAVLSTQNFAPAYYRARAAAAGRPLDRARYRFEAMRSARYIGRSVRRRYRSAIAVSGSDADMMAAAWGVPVDVVPNRCHTLGSPPAPAVGEPTVLFTGTMSYAPNSEAAAWLLKEIWPRVQAAVPAARLEIVGRSPDRKISELAEETPGATVRGFVESMEPYYQQATVAVAPLLSGSGTRLKILDAMAHQRAVVATTIGAEGLDVVPGTHLEVSDSSEGFADAVAALLQDAARRDRLAAAGRLLVRERYDWHAVAGNLADVLQRACGPRSRPR